MDFQAWYAALKEEAIRIGLGPDYVKNCGGAREWYPYWILQYSPKKALKEYAKQW